MPVRNILFLNGLNCGGKSQPEWGQHHFKDWTLNYSRVKVRAEQVSKCIISLCACLWVCYNLLFLLPENNGLWPGAVSVGETGTPTMPSPSSISWNRVVWVSGTWPWGNTFQWALSASLFQFRPFSPNRLVVSQVRAFNVSYLALRASCSIGLL